MPEVDPAQERRETGVVWRSGARARGRAEVEKARVRELVREGAARVVQRERGGGG